MMQCCAHSLSCQSCYDQTLTCSSRLRLPAAQTPAGTDINKVGINPDVELQGQAQPPLEGAGFCKFAGPDEVRQSLLLHMCCLCSGLHVALQRMQCNRC